MSVNVYNKNDNTLTKLAGNIGIANNDRLGVIKPDGSTITIDADGTLHGSAQVSPATTTDAGIVKPDGTTITIDTDGTLHGATTVDIATTSTVGTVKPDGSTITIDTDGTIHGTAKETIDTELSSTSTNAVQNKILTEKITELQDGQALVYTSAEWAAADKTDIKDGTRIIISDDCINPYEYVDSVLSDESLNPVQNKVIAAAIYKITDSLDDKITEPATDGINGQALVTDGNGGRSWQKVTTDLTNVYGTSDAYSSSATYAEGDVCIYNDALWKCVTACTDQEPSEGTYWTKITLNSLLINFQGGVDSVYDAIVAQGTTPTSKSLSDVETGITTMSTNRYNDGVASVVGTFKSAPSSATSSGYATASVSLSPGTYIVCTTGIMTAGNTSQWYWGGDTWNFRKTSGTATITALSAKNAYRVVVTATATIALTCGTANSGWINASRMVIVKLY